MPQKVVRGEWFALVNLTLLLAALPLLSPSLLALEPITGKVTVSGTPVPGANIIVQQDQKKWSAVTDAKGEFRVDGVGAGPFTISSEMFGFDKTSKEILSDSGRTGIELSLSFQKLAQARPARPAAGGARGASRRAGPGAGFQRMTLQQNSAEAALNQAFDQALSPEPPPQAGDASESYLVQGSVSSTLDRTDMWRMGPMMDGERPGSSFGTGARSRHPDWRISGRWCARRRRRPRWWRPGNGRPGNGRPRGRRRLWRARRFRRTGRPARCRQPHARAARPVT